MATNRPIDNAQQEIMRRMAEEMRQKMAEQYQDAARIQYAPSNWVTVDAVYGLGKAEPNPFKAGDKVVIKDPKGIKEVGEVKKVSGDNVSIKFPSQPKQFSTQHRFLRKAKKSDYPKPKPKIDFNSVVIADHKRQQIIEALEQIHQHDLIFDQWGFDQTIEKGKGVSMLFYGPPGTGKTLMGQAIANKLDRKLLIIGTADIESSAPGESERNIRKYFEDAKKEGNILLFDECDSLIYTRQNVGPILGAQINELLSQIERFDGITLFTTNRLGTLDEAVNRRLALKLEFNMPTVEERVKIWQRMIPKAAPIDKDIDWERLAGLEITGGYIKNAVLRAARMAAIEDLEDKHKKIRMEHLVRALSQEAESMIEFEDAKQSFKSGYAHVDGTDGNGQKIVHKVVKNGS